MPVIPIVNDPWFEGIGELTGPREGTAFDMSNKEEYHRQFLVIVKSPDMGPVDVCRCPGLPLPGSRYVTPYAYDLLAVLKSVHAKQRYQEEGNWQHWLVDQVYSRDFSDTKGGPKTDPSKQDKPEEDPPDISWDDETIQVARQNDINGDPIVNSANLPFSPPPTIPIGISCLNITRNEILFEASKATQYAYAVNIKPFLGVPKGCVQCYPPKAKMAWRGSNVYWKVTYKLRFAPVILDDPATDPITGDYLYRYKPWEPVEIQDEGMYELGYPPEAPDIIDKPRPIFIAGVPVHHAVLLDGKGHRAKKGSDGTLEATFLKFSFYRYADFTKLLVRGLA